jgi:hypothetical protein
MQALSIKSPLQQELQTITQAVNLLPAEYFVSPDPDNPAAIAKYAEE